MLSHAGVKRQPYTRHNARRYRYRCLFRWGLISSRQATPAESAIAGDFEYIDSLIDTAHH